MGYCRRMRVVASRYGWLLVTTGCFGLWGVVASFCRLLGLVERIVIGHCRPFQDVAGLDSR